jgi:hypothetical protein
MKTSISFRNSNPNTIWNKLAAKLGREPTHAEACAEVRRIKQSATADLASQGKLSHQRGR